MPERYDVQGIQRLSVFDCASVNEQVVHGFPSGYKLKEEIFFRLTAV
jgi:hypothetical protein